MVRKDDIIALCNKHADCEFLAFTNATLIDEAFADEMLRVKNFIPAISVEGAGEGHLRPGGAGRGDPAGAQAALRHLLLLHLPKCRGHRQ